MSKIYVIGSLRKDKVPNIGSILRADDHEVFDDWHSAGPQADDCWRRYEQARGRTYEEALSAPVAVHTFEFDRKWIHWADVGVLVLPAGKSGHLELGYMIGRGQRGYILLEQEDPERWDCMYQFAHGVTGDLDKLREWVR